MDEDTDYVTTEAGMKQSMSIFSVENTEPASRLWQAVRLGNTLKVIDAVSRDTIAVVGNDSPAFQIMFEANALLMAAAPALLDSVERLINATSGVDHDNALRECRAAIAKAKGTTPSEK